MPNVHRRIWTKCRGCGVGFGARADKVKRGMGKFHDMSCRASFYMKRDQKAAKKVKTLSGAKTLAGV